MKIIRATLTFEIPVEKLKEGERAMLEEEFESLRREVTETSPNGITATLKLEEIDAIAPPGPTVCSCERGMRDTKCPVHGDVEG